MTQTPYTPLTSEQQALVLSCDIRIRRLARKYARNTFDFEEMYSLGMEAVCKVVGRVSTSNDPFGYLYRSAQNAMIDELKRKERTSALSLDAPFSSTSTFCLADTLASCSPLPVEQTASSSVVQRALTRLSPREREVLHHRYGFDGSCGILSSASGEIAEALDMTRGGAASIATVAHRKLRADKELCSFVGVEPPPKAQVSPELLAERYAQELQAWKCGCRSVRSLGKTLSISQSTARQRLVKLREVGLIPRINHSRGCEECKDSLIYTQEKVGKSIV